MSIAIRRATPEDTPAVAQLLADGFASYRAFAPEGWQPPVPHEQERLAIEGLLGRESVWFVVAEDDAGHAGQCGVHPASTQRAMRGDPLPGAAQLWQLFVRQDLWGEGLADRLHGLALQAMHERDYEWARLHTPSGQARARHFYEKRGWRESGVSLADPPDLAGLPMVEYRLGLAGDPPG